MSVIFEGRKSQRPINCTSILLFSYLLWLENDEGVTSYFEPQMNMVAPHNGTDYEIPVHLWVSHAAENPSFIGLLDEQTEQLFRDHPEILANVEEHARSINAQYVPVRQANLPDVTVTILPDLRVPCEGGLSGPCPRGQGQDNLI